MIKRYLSSAPISLTHSLKKDSYAAFMVSLLLIPQAIAYAMIAGVPAVHGLYAAIFPLFVYSLLGSAPLLSVGPVAVVSVMVFTGLASMVPPHSPLYLALVALLSLMVGFLQMVFSICKCGSLFRLIPSPVFRGFINALALTIILNQLGGLLGITFQKDLPFFAALLDLGFKYNEINASVFFFSCFFLLFYIFLRKKRVAFPSLLLIIVSSLAVYFLNLEKSGIEKVGYVESGWPSWELPTLLPSYLPALLPLAFFIALLSFIESYTMAVELEKGGSRKVDPNQELFALGLANITGSLVQAIPVAGAFSRSAVNKDCDAQTRMSSMLTAGFVLLLSVYFTAPLAFLPLSALALIIIFAAQKLIHWSSFTHPLVILTTASSLLIGLKIGFCIGVFGALVYYLFKKRAIH